MPRKHSQLCSHCGKRHAPHVTCDDHRASLSWRRLRSRTHNQCHACLRRHSPGTPCNEHAANLRLRASRRTTRALQPCTVCGARHPATVDCPEHSVKLVDLASSRASRAQSACAICSAHHAPTITCQRHQAHLARRCSSRGGVLHDHHRRPSFNDTHFDTDELRARAKRDPSPIPATRIRDMSRAAHDYLHAPSHVCLVCQLEFSSLPLGSTKRFEWTIGLVIDRGYPKLCFPKSLAPLDPLMRDQCRVAVPGLSASRAKKLSDMLLCPLGVGTPAGEATPVHLCAACSGNLLRRARNPPRLSLANNVIDARAPQMDGLTDAEKRAVAPVNVRGAVTFVTSDHSRGQAIKQNAQLRGHTLAYPAATYQLAQHLPNVPATTARVVFASATTERATLAALRAETIRVQQTSDAIRFLCAHNERVAKLGYHTTCGAALAAMRVQATNDGDGHSFVNADVVRVPDADDDHPDAKDARAACAAFTAASAVTSDNHGNADATSSNVARLARSMQLSGLRDEVMAEQSAYMEACEECGDTPDPDTLEYFDAHIHSLNAAVRLHDGLALDAAVVDDKLNDLAGDSQSDADSDPPDAARTGSERQHRLAIATMSPASKAQAMQHVWADQEAEARVMPQLVSDQIQEAEAMHHVWADQAAESEVMPHVLYAQAQEAEVMQHVWADQAAESEVLPHLLRAQADEAEVMQHVWAEQAAEASRHRADEAARATLQHPADDTPAYNRNYMVAVDDPARHQAQQRLLKLFQTGDARAPCLDFHGTDVAAGVAALRTGSTLYSDRNRDLLALAFPELNPFGRGGYADKRPMKVSFKSWLCSRMRSGVQDYARSPLFVLLAYSILSRATMNDHIYFSASAPYTTEAAAAGGVVANTVESYGEHITPQLVDSTIKVLQARDDARRRSLPPPPLPPELSSCATFLNSVKAQTRHAMHSDEAAAAALPRVMALARAFSMPSLFVTFSLDYSCLRPLLMVTLGRIAGGKIDGTYQMRTHALAHAPGEAAKAYLAAFDAFLECVQLWSAHASVTDNCPCPAPHFGQCTRRSRARKTRAAAAAPTRPNTAAASAATAPPTPLAGTSPHPKTTEPLASTDVPAPAPPRNAAGNRRRVVRTDSDAASDSESESEAKANRTPPSRRASAAYIESEAEEAEANHDSDANDTSQAISLLDSDGDSDGDGDDAIQGAADRDDDMQRHRDDGNRGEGDRANGRHQVADDAHAHDGRPPPVLLRMLQDIAEQAATTANHLQAFVFACVRPQAHRDQLHVLVRSNTELRRRLVDMATVLSTPAAAPDNVRAIEDATTILTSDVMTYGGSTWTDLQRLKELNAKRRRSHKRPRERGSSSADSSRFHY